MSTENYRGFKLRHCKDHKSPGKVRTYVEKGVTTRTQHIHKARGSRPAYICYKTGHKPSSLAEAKSKAHKWADLYG